MKINDISLPYPVLGISDDVLPLLKKDCVSIERPTMTATSLQSRFTSSKETRRFPSSFGEAKQNMSVKSTVQGHSIESATSSHRLTLR